MNRISRKSTIQRNQFFLQWVFAGVLVTVVGGCASFANVGGFGGKSEAKSDPAKMYRVEMSNMMGSPSVYEGEVTENMTVQNALEKSGATRRYRNMDLAVIRVVEETGQPLRMVVQYNPAKKKVSPEQDYALMPGDRVVIEPASGMMDKLTGRK